MNVETTSRGGVSPRARTSDRALPLEALATVGPWLAQAGLPFLLLVYLGMRGGGYDAVVRGEIGIAVWWVVLIGAAVGALPISRLGRGTWISLGLLFAFAVWTALGIGWSESAERSVAELGRVASLLGVFALAVAIQGSSGLGRMVSGVAAGIGVIGVVALLSRLHPAWFPALEVPEFNPGAQARLHYPLNYWNGLAAFMAMGIPLLLALATVARNLFARSLVVAVVPVLALTAFFTLSRGGLVELAVALVVLFALHPRRLTLLAPAALAGAGSLILIAAASQRDDLTDGLTTATGISQGNEMLFMTIVVCAGVALLASALGLAVRHGVGPRIRVPRPSRRIVVAAAMAALVVALVAGLPGALSNGWEGFKESAVPNPETARFDSSSGSGRYQWWVSAVDANATDPLVGIGPGTFEFWWAREGTIPGFVRDAHSLYMETFAELGIIGLLLIVGFVLAPFAFGVKRLLRASGDERILLAGALAACAAFASAAALEWVWELTVLPVAFLLLVAAVVARRTPASEDERGGVAPRFMLAGVALAGMVAVAIPMASASALRDSQAEVRAQDLGAALDQANAASNIQPYAASASLQEALVLELQGDVDGAVAAARMATGEEATNWRTWLVLSRLEAQAGNAEASVAAYREARSLNPRSPLFQ